MDVISRKINILLNVEKSFIPKAEYIFRTFCRVIGLQPEFFYDHSLEDIGIYYGNSPVENYPVEIYHNPDAVVFFNRLTYYTYNDVRFSQYRNEHVPFLFSRPGLLLHQAKKSFLINKDIISSAFYFLSCWEEYVDLEDDPAQEKKEKKRDSKNQVSLIEEWDLSLQPVVDRYCEIFQKAIEIALPGYLKGSKWFDCETFAVSISHFVPDIDNVNANKELNPFKTILAAEKKKAVKSGFLVPSQVNENDADEGLSIPESYTSLISRYQIYADPSQNSDQDLTVIAYSYQMQSAEEIEVICDAYSKHKFSVRGYFYNNLKTHYGSLFSELEKSSILFDMSIASQRIGFRAGVSFPYYPFNLQRNNPYKVLEIPCSVYLNSHQEVSSVRQLKAKLAYMLDDTKKYYSTLNIITNNGNNISTFYLYLLSYCYKKGGRLTTPHNLYGKVLT